MVVVHLGDLNEGADKIGYKAQALQRFLTYKLPVPETLVITADSFIEWVTAAGIAKDIEDQLQRLDISDDASIRAVSQTIQGMLKKIPLSDHLIKEIRDRYDELALGPQIRKIGGALLDIIRSSNQIVVAVRPSPLTYSTNYSYPTELNVFGINTIIPAVKKCWIAAFSPENLKNSKDVQPPAIIIQKMINADKSGVLFTTHPLEKSSLRIEASWGIGDWITNGTLTPDVYEIDTEAKNTLSRTIGNKSWMKKVDSVHSTLIKYKVPEELATQQTISFKEIRSLLQATKSLPAQLCVEWCMERNNLYFLTAKPLKHSPLTENPVQGTVVAKGTVLAPGEATGTAKLLTVTQESLIEKGDIVVTKALPPDLLPLIFPAAGFIVEEGGMASFAACYAREHAIPCLLFSKATNNIQNDVEITVSNETLLYKQSTETSEPPETLNEPPASTVSEPHHPVELIHAGEPASDILNDLPTPAAYASEPAHLQQYTLISSFPFSLTGTCAIVQPSALFDAHTFPLTAVRESYEQTKKQFVSRLKQLQQHFSSRIWYQVFDITSDIDEEDETNPLLGWRGLKRLIDQPELFRFERDLIQQVSTKQPIGLILPSVSSLEELKIFKKTLYQDPLPLGITLATPAAAYQLEAFFHEGIQAVFIAIDELSQYFLGIDRNNAHVSKYFTFTSPPFLSFLHMIIDTCTKHTIPFFFLGTSLQNASLRKAYAQQGITPLIFSPDKE